VTVPTDGRGNHPGQRAGRLRAVTRRLLARLGSAVLPDTGDDLLPKDAAIVRAITAVPYPGGLRVWTFADATLVFGLWLVILEDLRAVHVVEVDARTGDTRIVTSVVRRRGAHDTTPTGQHPARWCTSRTFTTVPLWARRARRPVARDRHRQDRARHATCRMMLR